MTHATTITGPIAALPMTFSSSRAQMPDPDGFFRVRLHHLSFGMLEHVLSCIDEALLRELHDEGISATHAGYTEWRLKECPQASVGWDWYRTSEQRIYAAPAAVRMNVMLIDAKGYDLGMDQSSALIKSWLGSVDWQKAVADGLGRELG